MSGDARLSLAIAQETQVRRADDKKVFDAVDQDDNGFLTYQDIEKLSREMGEKMNYQQLNTIMDTATDEGTMRRITMERFEDVCALSVVLDPSRTLKAVLAKSDRSFCALCARLLLWDGDQRCLPPIQLCRHPVAWNELDMLRCHEELLQEQANEVVPVLA